MKKVKEEQGITLVALIIMIIIILILAGVSIQTGTESLDSTRLKGFYTQLEVIQKRVDDIAATNENYLDSAGNIVYLKETGIAYEDLTDAQKESLQNILALENIDVNISNFRYFTVQDLKDKLDLIEMQYNVFIDFDNRIIIAEDGIKVGDEMYYVLEDATYFVEHNTTKNTGTIGSLSYEVSTYTENKYKVIITPSNTIGDISGTDYVKYKKTTTKYWEISDNTQIVVELDTKYDIMYVDSNNNSLEKIIKVGMDDTGSLIVTED